MIQTIRRILWLGALSVMATTFASAASANVAITDPTNGAVVRGEITVRFSGIPSGGYAIVKVDNNFAQATASPSFTLNTFDPLSFGASQGASTEGAHKVSVTGVDASGKSTNTATVSFTVANGTVDTAAPSVLLTHWVPIDRLDEQAQRYRIFAESDAVVTSPQGGGGGVPVAASDGTPSGGAAAPEMNIALDWQYSALLRRVVRDVGLYNKAANIKISVAEAFQRQREGASTTGAMEGVNGEMPNPVPQADTTQSPASASGKPPWSKIWMPAPESGNYFVKTIEPDGKEINATRKKRTIAITDLLPTFPDGEVQPGSRWNSKMTFLSDLSARDPFNVEVPITFTGFEDIKLPSGQVRRAAKLESRFRLDKNSNGDIAKKMAAELAVRGGIATGGQGGGIDLPAAPGMENAGAISTADSDASAIATAEANIKSANVRISRVIWFDVDRHRVLRSQDQINTFFEMKQEAQAQGEGGIVMAPGAMPGMGIPGENAAPAAPAEPTRVNYTMNVLTWYDDTMPAPTDQYNAGRGTAHSKDNVQEPSLSKVTTGR